MRDRVALGALRENFIRRLEENDDHCPYCKKFLANVKKKNETFLRHAEQHCTSEWRKRRREHMEAEERRADFQPAIEFDIVHDRRPNSIWKTMLGCASSTCQSFAFKTCMWQSAGCVTRRDTVGGQIYPMIYLWNARFDGSRNSKD